MMISLWFTGSTAPQLERCETHTSAQGRLLSIRGKGNGAFGKFGSFQWSGAVRALCALLVQAKITEDEAQSIEQRSEEFTPELSHLFGEAGSLAASLDYALSKGPEWIVNMFGADKSGVPFAQRLIHRSNANRKRPGPVLLRLNLALCGSENIKIFLDERELLDIPSLRQLHGNLVSSKLHPGIEEPPSVPSPLANPLHTETSILDTMIGLILAKRRIEKQEVREILAAEYGWLTSPLNFARLVRRLCVDGFLYEDGQVLSIAPHFAESVEKLFQNAADVDSQHENMGIASYGQGGARLDFRTTTIQALDTLLPELHSVCLKFQCNPNSQATWFLQHSWWPLLRPDHFSCSNLPRQGSTNLRYVSSSDSAYDRWTAEKLSKSGIIVNLADRERAMPCDSWHIENLLVVQKFEPQLRNEIHSFLSSCRRPERLDPDQFRAQFFAEQTEVQVRLMLRPYGAANFS